MTLRILHITKDDKFFDSLISAFDTDKRVESRSVVINNAKTPLEYIKKGDRVESVTVSELKQILHKGEYDAVYFHSIPETVWRIVLWVPKGKTIIWWSWGYDLYRSRLPYFRPLIALDLYKERTLDYYSNIPGPTDRINIKGILSLIKARYLENCRKRALSRIDYYIPVIPQEYELLVRKYSIKSKLLANPWASVKVDFEYPGDSFENGHILLGNSSSITNNHLDVWYVLENLKFEGRKIILPVSYGDPHYRDFLKDQIRSDSNEIVFLEKMMPLEEYNALMGKCRYALFGVIRQQAIGNVEICLQRGIKMFFFKDSMVYRYLKDIGCYVFPIEEMDINEISTPLSREQALHNFNAWSKYRASCANIYNSVINNLINNGNN